jgi:hypothetical protein
MVLVKLVPLTISFFSLSLLVFSSQPYVLSVSFFLEKMERTLKNEKDRLQNLSEQDEEGKNRAIFFYLKLFPCILQGRVAM